MKRVFRLAGVVKLRPPIAEENASILLAVYAAVHEAIFLQGVTLPLFPNLQILLCKFGIAFGQVLPNMWRLLMALNSLWPLSVCEGPIVAKVLHFYKLVYVRHQGCNWQVNLSRRQGAPKLIENLKDFMSAWRGTFCVTTAGWEYQVGLNEGALSFRIKSEFQPIQGCCRSLLPKVGGFCLYSALRYTLTREEECCVARIKSHWRKSQSA
ncbi:hypothetical protein RchiOBHm_Chr2g0140201 [Rosa chinensis]|uniref:Uncharacterized protein n=1 Tax=Rosa chinensis TaxID=74649 RepID=A0A2P6RXB0_ROSCH|nr:hypothetical protein RchiOBHm_Chr2g0140201 [Rosa chinensis]